MFVTTSVTLYRIISGVKIFQSNKYTLTDYLGGSKPEEEGEQGPKTVAKHTQQQPTDLKQTLGRQQ
jgi:hypothetical protein